MLSAICQWLPLVNCCRKVAQWNTDRISHYVYCRTPGRHVAITTECMTIRNSWSGIARMHADCNHLQEGLAVASIVQDDPSTLPGDDPFPRACMPRDCNAR